MPTGEPRCPGCGRTVAECQADDVGGEPLLSKRKPKLPLFDSGSPALGEEASAMFGGGGTNDEGLRSAQYGIEQALRGLAMWCPHGGDSSRVSDYYDAEEARELLKKAQAIIGKPGQEPW